MSKKETNYIIGLDIGSTKICAAICEVKPKGELSIESFGISISAGIQKGRVIDINELQKAIDRAIKKAEQHINVRPTKIIISTPCYQVESIHHSGLIIPKQENGKITQKEKLACLERAKKFPKSQDKKILHMFPYRYKINNEPVSNPIGLKGSSLEIDNHIILGDIENINKVKKTIENLNLHLIGLVYDGLASSEVILSPEEKQSKTLFIDIGGQFTKLCFFDENSLQNTIHIPIGGETITSDLAYCLKVTTPEAERLKILYADILLSQISSSEKIEINTKQKQRTEIDRLYICKIVEARVAELISLIKKSLSEKKLAPETIILSGGSCALKGLNQYLSTKLQRPIRTGLPEHMQNIIERIDYSTAVGTIVYGLKTRMIPHQNNHSIFIKSLKNSFLPLQSAFSLNPGKAIQKQLHRLKLKTKTKSTTPS